MTEEKPKTMLSGKEHSPMIIRRYSMPVLHFISIISDDNLDSLDKLVDDFWKTNPKNMTIQDWRKIAGNLNEIVIKAYPKIEGSAVIISADKMLISSIAGDFMCHPNCKLELFLLLNMATGV